MDAFVGEVELIKFERRQAGELVGRGVIAPNPPVTGDCVTVGSPGTTKFYTTKKIARINALEAGGYELLTKNNKYVVRSR